MTIAAVVEDVRAEAMASIDVVDLTAPVPPGDQLRSSDGRPVHLPPSAVRYTTRHHLQRELAIVDWAKSTGDGRHQRVETSGHSQANLDNEQAPAVATMLTVPRPVLTVVGPAGAGKTRMLATAVEAWRQAEVPVYGVGPSASAARQLQDGANTAGDTLHKLVYEHSTKQNESRGPAGPEWDLPERSVVILDEAGMVDTRLLHQYAQIAQTKKWRTILVGDDRQLDSVDAGGMFAALIDDPGIATVELNALHRFEHEWEADASLAVRDGDAGVVDTYDRHDRIHGYPDQAAAIQAVADEAFASITDRRDVLVMAPTNVIVDELNATLTDRLVHAGWLDSTEQIEIGGSVFYPGQPIVTRTNDRTLTYGPNGEEWVRNGDRWIVNAGTRHELYVTNLDNGHLHTLPADYTTDGNVTVDYASTINRAQGATVDEAHLIITDQTNAKQLYVGVTRGRTANHIHTAPPAPDLDDHSLPELAGDPSPADSMAAALRRDPDEMSAIGRRRQLRELSAEPNKQRLGRDDGDAADQIDQDLAVFKPAAAAIRRLQQMRHSQSNQSRGR